MKNLQEQFDEWLDAEMKKVKGEVVAYNVNIYEEADEDSDDAYSVDLVAFDEYDEYDADWACGDGIYASHCDDTLLYFEVQGGWEECLEKVKDLIGEYLQHGKYGKTLKSAEVVGCGFVDGDIEFVYQREI